MRNILVRILNLGSVPTLPLLPPPALETLVLCSPASSRHTAFSMLLACVLLTLRAFDFLRFVLPYDDSGKDSTSTGTLGAHTPHTCYCGRRETSPWKGGKVRLVVKGVGGDLVCAQAARLLFSACMHSCSTVAHCNMGLCHYML